MGSSKYNIITSVISIMSEMALYRGAAVVNIRWKRWMWVLHGMIIPAFMCLVNNWYSMYSMNYRYFMNTMLVHVDHRLKFDILTKS